MTQKRLTQVTAVKTRRAIVQLLKQEGSLDADTLATRLELTAMAVRQHLYALQDEHLVTYQEEPRPMGRPAKLWQLTSAADRLFPDGYAELTLSLLNALQAVFGEAGLEQLLEVRSQQQLESYRQQMQGKRSLKQRLKQLVTMRTHEGYMAEVKAQSDGTFLLVQNHCPICAAATACPEFCTKELEVFQTMLGTAINIERVEHIVAGDRRCTYHISQH